MYTWYSPNKGNGFRLDEAFVHKSLLPRLIDVRYIWGGMSSATAGTLIGPRNESKLLLDDRPLRRDVLSDHAALIVDFGA